VSEVAPVADRPEPLRIDAPIAVGSLDAPLPTPCLAAAEVATERFCVAHPDLLERYGERGREYTRHDFAYLFAWAVDAVALQEPAAFMRNVLWLRDLLAARDFPGAWYLASVRLARDVAVERDLLSEEDAVRVIDPVVAALGAQP
jgi:hypothetical protein